MIPHAERNESLVSVLNRPVLRLESLDMAAARPAWRGQIRLALVSIPVEIYPATKSGAQIQFHQVHEPSGKRIKYEKVVPGIGPVDKDEIEPMYFEKPYYVVPADDLAEEAYVVLRDALKDAKKIGIGQMAMRGQEYVVALKPSGRGILMEKLRYADEVHKSSGFFRDIGDTKPDPDLLDMASMLIERKAGEFDPSEFHNRYVDALKDLIAEKQKKKGEKVIQDPDADKGPPKGSNVIDLMAALKKSLGDDKRKKDGMDEPKARKAAPKKAAAKRTTAKKESKEPARKRA